MKKFFVMLGLLLGFVAQQYASAEPIVAPEAGKEYYIVHSSGMFLSQDGTSLKIMSAGKNDNQVWVFEPTDNDSYNIKNASTSQYLGSDNGWTAKFASSPSEMPNGEAFANWQLNVSYLPDWIVLKNVGINAYAGSDSNSEGAGVYTNKAGNDGKHLWQLLEKTEGAYTGALEVQIDAAEALIAEIGTNVGSGHGQYAQSAVDALNAALAEAKAAMNSSDQTVVNDAETALKNAISNCQGARNVIIDLTKKYAFKQQISGYVLGLSDANKAALQSLALTSTQVYTFEPVEGEKNTFNFKNNGGTYIGKASNNYDIIPFDEANDNTKFIIVLNDIDADGVSWYYIYNVSRGGYVATDNNSEGSGIYCDKGMNERGLWAFTEIDESEVVTTALEMAIANAQAAFNGKTIGDGPNEYPQSAVDALNAAIAVAQAALDAKENQAAINKATDDLNAAISRFLDSKIVFKADPTKQYYFMQEASSLILTMENNVATINNPQGLDAQKFRLIPVEEGSTSAYNLQLANGTDYLIRKGGWDTGVGTDPTVDVAKWRFEIADLENGYYLLRKYETTGYFATDSNTPGSWVYCNKGNSANGRWKIIEVVEGQALTDALDAAIANAQALLAGAVAGEEPYNYPQEAIDALTAAIAAANAADRASQESVNNATIILQDAISDFKAAQIMPWFRPEAGVKYRFSTNKYESKYMTNVDGSAKTTAAFTSGDAGQQWTLTEVDGKNHVYVIYNGSSVLDYEGNVVDPSTLEEMPKWRTIYTNTRNYIDYFALVQDADPTKVVAFSSGNTWAIQTLSTDNNAHQGRFMRVDPVNDPNLGALEIAIATAQAALDGVDRGPAIGQYSDAKCAAFQALIDQAKTYYNGKTQAEVDAEVAALNKARVDFINNPNSVIRDELDAALAQLATIIENAEIGIEVGQFTWSQIDALKAKLAEFTAAGKNVSEQEDCDALTAEVLAYIESNGKGHTAKQDVKTVLNDAIACAEAIYEAEKDNVGTDKGQRPQEVVNAFRDAIATAKAVTNPTVADLEALLDAYNAFMNGAISVDRTALRKAIANAQDEKYANLVAGNFDGQYPQDKIDDFQTALATAIDVEADMTKTQDDVNTAATNLNKARTALDSSKVKIAFTTLDANIAKAETAVAGVTEIGQGEGKCPQAAVDNINAVISEAKAIDRAAIAQADVDQLSAKLAEALITFNAIVKENSGIDAAIAKANETLEDVTIGFKPGNYPASAVADLQNAIANAQAVANNADATQGEMIAATKALNDAIEAFKAEAVPANDLTALNAAIAAAEAAIANGLDDMNVILALAFAKEAAEAPNEYTQSEIDQLASDLELALTVAGVDTVTSAKGIAINGGVLTVTGIEGEYAVAVYTTDGRLVSAAKACGEAVQINLANGYYVIAISAADGNVTTTVRVK